MRKCVLTEFIDLDAQPDDLHGSGPAVVQIRVASKADQAAGWRHVGTEHGESRYELLKQDWTRRSSPS